MKNFLSSMILALAVILLVSTLLKRKPTPCAAHDLLTSAGWSNIAIHADKGSACVWLGQSNLAFFEIVATNRTPQ